MIVAVASPPGRALRAIVRLSGSPTRHLAARWFGSDAALRVDVEADVGADVEARAPAHRCVRRVRIPLTAGEHGDTVRCPVIAFWMPAPASFTGEDSLEIVCVGSPTVAALLAQHAVEQAAYAGYEARFARPGEFAFRAYLAGRLSIDEAESIAARIAAKGDAELLAAAEVARGAFGLRAAELVAQTAEALALVEAGIDFTDQEDVVAIPLARLLERVTSLREHVASLRGMHGSLAATAVPTVVLAGAPNAGKSSLFNALVGKARSVASAVAGSTRDAIATRVQWSTSASYAENRMCDGSALEFELVDLAGLVDDDAQKSSSVDETGHSIAALMQSRARTLIAHADLVVRCAPLGDVPPDLPSSIDASRVLDVITKADLSLTQPLDNTQVRTSSSTGFGIDALRSAIVARLSADRTMHRAQLASILPRHDAALSSALAALDVLLTRLEGESVRSTSRAVGDPEIVASLLRAALDHLGDIAGPVHPDDVLGLVFSRFCVGK